MIELDALGDTIRMSTTAEPLLAELSGSTMEDGLRSASIQTVASATRAATAYGRAAGGPALPKTPAGTWLVLHGAQIGTPRSGEVAVFIQRAHPTLVAPLLLKAYGLTPREQEVTQLVLCGATAVQSAQRLAISPHTVNDHLKAIFEKTGSRTRGELSRDAVLRRTPAPDPAPRTPRGRRLVHRRAATPDPHTLV